MFTAEPFADILFTFLLLCLKLNGNIFRCVFRHIIFEAIKRCVRAVIPDKLKPAVSDTLI